MPLALRLPLSWGWENGPAENLQAVLLAAGAVVAAWGVHRHPRPVAVLWQVVVLFWLAMMGRELAWGAALVPPLSFSPEMGPTISSKILWYRPAVPWVVGALLIWAVYAVLRHRVLGRVIWPWWKQGVIPWGSLGVFVLAMLVSTHAEGHALLGLPLPPAHAAMVMEEVSELWAYAALWWAQWQLVRQPDWHPPVL